MLLRYGLGRTGAADRLDAALDAALSAGAATRDLGGGLSTEAFTAEVVAEIRRRARAA